MSSVPFDVYLITDRQRTRGRPLMEVLKAALAGGIQAVQVREKDLSTRELFRLVQEIKGLCAQYNAYCLINDRIDVALALDLNGVHLPANGFPVSEARRLLGPGKIIGRSTHSAQEAEKAGAEGADFVTLGPVFHTPSKESWGKPLGVEALVEAARKAVIPVFALGGINIENIYHVARAGAWGIAMVSAVLQAEHPENVARQIMQKWRNGKK